MNKLLIYTYIKSLTKEDIINFFKKESIIITNHDLELIYYYLKNDYKSILDNPEHYLNLLEKNIQKEPYYLIKKYYNKYKNEII